MTISIVIPACDEEAVIGRLLDALLEPEVDEADEADEAPALDVVVVCNGCTDSTEEVARRHPVGAVVVSTPVGSKHAALVLGDRHARGFPRFYVDADVVVSAADVRALARHLDAGRLVVAPSRALRTERSSWWVRAYYAVWEQLPVVEQGLFGRGVLGVSAEGFARISDRPDVLGDDLFVELSFSAAERFVDRATTSQIQAPRGVGDLLRRRTRVQQGNRQLADHPGEGRGAGPTLRDVLRTVTRRSATPAQAAVFLAVTVAGRLRARARPDGAPWLRDESSRSA